MTNDRQRFAESTLRVRYAETDQMGIAHHASYLPWFEIGRTDLCRETGLTYRRIEELGFLLVVSEIGCRYRKPFRYDDLVIIRTRIGKAATRSLRFEYELWSEGAEELHADGFSAHLWLHAETRSPIVAPQSVLSYFSAFLPK